jgi:hypothetical protein
VTTLPPEPPATPSDLVIREFMRHLQEERGFSHETIAYYVPLARRFLKARFAAGKARLRELAPRDASDFVGRLSQDHGSGLRTNLLGALRTFFYGKLGAILGRQSDLASRRAVAQANFELAELATAWDLPMTRAYTAWPLAMPCSAGSLARRPLACRLKPA